MDVDEKPILSDHDAGQLFSLSIECESSPAELYPSMRISDAWLSPSIEKATDDDPTTATLFPTSSIDWQDPPPTYINSSDGQNTSMTLDGTTTTTTTTLPNVRFVAKLHPPLVLPLQTAVQILTTVGATVPPETIRPTTFEALALRPADAAVDAMDAATSELVRETTKEVRAERRVLVAAGEEECTHVNTLFVPKVEYGRVLEEIPFVHPRQVVEVLPVSHPPLPFPAHREQQQESRGTKNSG